MMRSLMVMMLGAALASGVQGESFVINAATGNANNRQSFDFSTDVWLLDVNDFAVSGPLVFANNVGGDPGVLGTGLDDPNTFSPQSNVIVLRNFDNNDPTGFPANWDNSFNARNALRAIANNTDGDRPGFYLYWNEKLGVNRLAYTSNLNDGEAPLTILFAINSENLTSNADDLQADPTFRPEANANFNTLVNASEANFAFVPEPSAALLLAFGLAGVGLRRRAV